MDDDVKKFNAVIVKIGCGDVNAINQLYENYSGLMFLMVKKYLVNKDYTEDVLSEVFCRIVTYSKKFNSKLNGFNWLFKTIKNCCMDWNKNNGYNIECIDDYENFASCLISVEQSIEIIDLRSALLKLNDEENKLLYYKYWEGLTVREIAKRMNKPKSTIQVMIENTLKKLNTYLTDLEGKL
jgi:RNA polymerase sigma-70 factor (ECF subfamily)